MRSLPVSMVVAGAVVLALGAAGGILYRSYQRPAPAKPSLTPEAAAYLEHLQLSEVDMQAAENYLKHTVTTITGKITNHGPRTVRLVEIHCVFRNLSGQIILREPTAIIGRKTGPAPSGQTRAFQLNFDNIPAGWNQAMPDLVISQIQFEK